MARANVPLLSFNRGLLSPKALARVDLDRTRLSAEVFTNWLPKTQGAMSIRPGTKYCGSSYTDTGAEWIEYVASTDDVALLELTKNKMRIWLGDDAHNLYLLERPKVSTTVSLSDTGWDDVSTGGVSLMPPVELIPLMSGPTYEGLTISASSENYSSGNPCWVAADRNITTHWADTGYEEASTLPTWWQVDFGSGSLEVHSYTLSAPTDSSFLPMTPNTWTLQCNDVDTGTGWITVDSQSGETSWYVGETRTYTRLDSDTGSVEAYRYWRLNFTATNGDYPLIVSEIQLFTSTVTQQIKAVNGTMVLNTTAEGNVAVARKKVVVDTGDYGVEHGLKVRVARGPIAIRVGSTDGSDDYIEETYLGTGYHNIEFTPNGNFYIRVSSDASASRIIGSMEISKEGVVEITTPWSTSDIENVRYDTSADVVFADCLDVKPYKIERRGTGRSWSVVEYMSKKGPFIAYPTSSAKLSSSNFKGNTTLKSDIPFFSNKHVGALFKVFNDGQSGQWKLGNLDAATDVIEITGISDTGTTPPNDSERAITITVTGTWAGTLSIENSYDGSDYGFKKISSSIGTADYTGNFSVTLIDKEDNYNVWYRVKFTAYTSGVAFVTITYGNGGKYAIARVTGYNSPTDVDIEVIDRFSDTGYSKIWQEGYWSELRGYPSAVALHNGRLIHAQGGNLFMSISDDYENFDEDEEGDAAPITRTLGSGPVNRIHYLISLLRLIIGTSGSELVLRTSTDEYITPSNCSVSTISTQGSSNLRALRMDSKALYAQRSGQRLFMISQGEYGSLGDYSGMELTILVPDLMEAGIVSIAIQRQPDSRIHCVLSDGTVAILTYEPLEEVVCWSKWETDGYVEKVSVLPGISEDAVYYHIRREVGDTGNIYYDGYTTCLLNGEGGFWDREIIDYAASDENRWNVVGNIHHDTGDKKFGRGALRFTKTDTGSTPTDDYIYTQSDDDFDLGSGDWTIDFWFKCDKPSGADAYIAVKGTTYSAAGISFLIHRYTNDKIRAEVSNGTSIVTLDSTTSFTPSSNYSWNHIAFVRTGNTVKLFVNGVTEDSDTFTGSVKVTTNSVYIGSAGDGGISTEYSYGGYIQNFRISKGIARWTIDFTPSNPAMPLKTVRYLEKWCLESECRGDTGLSWLSDCSILYTDTGRISTITGAEHLCGKSVVVWADDTGQTDAGKDLSTDVAGSQVTYIVDTGVGTVALSESVHHAVVGLPYTADWKSTKLAYNAEAGTALSQEKRVAQVAFVLHETHNNGLFFGSDTGNLDPLPRIIDGSSVDADHIYPHFDQVSMPFSGTHNPDSRIHLRAKAPRPCTVLAAIPSVQTNEKV